MLAAQSMYNVYGSMFDMIITLIYAWWNEKCWTVTVQTVITSNGYLNKKYLEMRPKLQ